MNDSIFTRPTVSNQHHEGGEKSIRFKKILPAEKFNNSSVSTKNEMNLRK